MRTLPMRLVPLLLLLALPALAAEDDFAFDEGYGTAASATAVFEPESGKPTFDMKKNREVKIPSDQKKRRRISMVFSVKDGALEPVLQHAGALEFWVLKGVDARTLRKALPAEPCYVKLTGDRVLEKWYAGGFSIEHEHGRLYSFFPERPAWVKTPQEMGEVQGRILAEREAAATARNASDFAGALAHFKTLKELEKDWPVGIPEGEEKTFRTLEVLNGMEKGDAAFLLSVAEGLPASRYEFEQTGRIRELLLARIKGADPALASNLEFQLLQWFKERYKDRTPDIACLDLVEMLSLVGARRSVLPMDDYYKDKVLPGPWKDELKARFAGYLQAIRDRAKASGP